ncbi:MAG: hypothetical protein ACK41Q_04925 [Candidatus Brocadia sp.]
MHRIRYRITTLSPALFVMNVGDTNMVASREYIPGSVVMGLFAGEFIKKNSLDRNAHTDTIFYQWFLNGDVRFTNAPILFHRTIVEIFGKTFPSPFLFSMKKTIRHVFLIYFFLMMIRSSNPPTRAVSGEWKETSFTDNR